jgi:hypothetical protein
MRIRNGIYGALVVGIFSGTIAIAAATGTWQTTGGGGGAGGGEGGGASSGATLTGASTTEIKGWMTIGDVATTWNVPLAEILAAFDLPADTAPSTALKDLESELFSVTNLRDWLDTRASSSGATAAP